MGRARPRHRLVVWSSDQICHRNIGFLRQGDRVKVKGRPAVYRFATAEGPTRELRQIVVERMRVLKRRHRPPEIPWHPRAPRRPGEAPASRGED